MTLLSTLNERIEAVRGQDQDAAFLLIQRVQLLLHSTGALGAVLEDCDAILSSDSKDTASRQLAHAVRALLLAFLGADGLAAEDVRACGGKVLLRSKKDCPAAFVCSAADWHRCRRSAMLRRHPELRDLYARKGDAVVTGGLLLLLTSVQFGLAVLVCPMSWWITVSAA